MAKEKVEIGRKTIRTRQNLPDDVVVILTSLPVAKRKAYAKLLVNAGWTYSAVAKPLGISRQAVEYYVKEKHSRSCYKPEMLEQVKNLPIPPLPTKPITKVKFAQVDEDTERKLKELHDIAKQIRGNTSKYREEAEELAKLVWEQMEQGISMYSIAKTLGITTSALAFRLVRYGYKTTNGKSKTYNQIKNRKANG